MIIDVYYDNEVLLVWNKNPDADGYTIYKKSNDHLFTSFKDTTLNKISLFGTIKDDEIKIKPYRTVGENKIYDLGFEKITLGNQVKFDNFIINTCADKSSANIVWQPIKEATEYKIYSGNKLLSKIQNCSYTARHLPVGVSDFYIEAWNGPNLITKSDVFSVEITDIELFGFNYDGKILLYWNKVPNIDGYRIFKKTSENVFDAFQTSTTQEAVVTNITAGEDCEFKVKPFVIKDGQREFPGLASKISIKVFSSDHIDLTVIEAYDNQIAISWALDGAVDGFDLFKSGEPYKEINDGLAHIIMDKYSDEEFQIKGYCYHFGEKVYVCASDTKTVQQIRTQKPENYKLSVIIPAYNSHDYISRTICSILTSTIDNVEAVIVDDGSKDNTKNVLDWYRERYPDFVKVTYKENGGVADTRNVGISKAIGKYIAFMDNDDIIRPRGFEKLYNMIEQTSSDIAVSPIYRIDNDKYVIRHKLPFEQNKAINIEDYLKRIFSDGFNNIGVWNKLYKREIVQAHPFGKLAYEDVSWTPYILSYADTFCYLDEVCYEWDRKIRPATFSNVLSNRSAEEKFKERYEAVRFFYDGGNPNRKECLAYLMAKRLYGQGKTAKYEGYFNAIKEMKSELINNKFLLEDKISSDKIMPLLD